VKRRRREVGTGGQEAVKKIGNVRKKVEKRLTRK
jgi:hypothetical protein